MESPQGTASGIRTSKEHSIAPRPIMLANNSHLEPAYLAWQGLGAASHLSGRESSLAPTRAPASWIYFGLVGLVVLATTTTESGHLSFTIVALYLLACLCEVRHLLWTEAHSVHEDAAPSEFDDPSASASPGKGWDFELQPVPATPQESVDAECEDEDEFVIWVELEDEEEEDSLDEGSVEEDNSGPWEWPDARDAS